MKYKLILKKELIYKWQDIELWQSRYLLHHFFLYFSLASPTVHVDTIMTARISESEPFLKIGKY